MSRPTYARPDRVVEFTLPSCPQCGARQLRTVRSVRDDEGVIRSQECRRCGEKFTAIGSYDEDCQDLEVAARPSRTMPA